MKIKIDKDNLYKAITVADSIVSSKNINTILSNCLFNVSKNEIEILSTDNDMAVRTKVDAIAEGAISFTANGKKFASILKELPKGELHLSIDDSMVISLKPVSKEVKGNYTLIGTTADDFPEILNFNDTKAYELNQSLLKEIIKKVNYAASTDTIKPVFNGIFLSSENQNILTTVATDSRRLSLIKRTLDDPIDLAGGVIIPLKTISEITRLLENDGTCKFSINNNQCFFQIDKTEVISRIVEGQFPNYKQVIPIENNIEVIIDTKKFLESIRRAMIFTREPAHKIILQFNENKLVIEVNTPELGESREEIDIESNSGEQIVIGINAQFLIDALKEIDSSSVKCGITGQMSPITLVPENDANFVSVIMPIQIKSSDE